MEKLKANLLIKSNSGKERDCCIILEYKVYGQNIAGQCISHESARCSRERAFAGALKGEVLKVRCKESEPQGCARLNFTGKKEADGSIGGKM